MKREEAETVCGCVWVCVGVCGCVWVCVHEDKVPWVITASKSGAVKHG